MATSTEKTIENAIVSDLASYAGITGVATVVNWLDNSGEVAYPLVTVLVAPRERLSNNHDIYRCRLDITSVSHCGDDKNGVIRDSVFAAIQDYMASKVTAKQAAGPDSTITLGAEVDGLLPLPAQVDFLDDIGMYTVSYDLFITIQSETGVFTQIAGVTDLSAAAFIEWTTPDTSEQITTVFDGIPSDDAANLIVELYSEGSWQTAGYVKHIAISDSASSSYLANNSANSVVAPLCGSDTGESVSVQISISNHANSLYPLIQIEGGYIDSNGDLARVTGTMAWQGTTTVTKARLRFSSGTIETGKYGVWGNPYGAFLPLSEGTEVTISDIASLSLSMADNPLYCAATGSLVPSADGTTLYTRVERGGSPETGADYQHHIAEPSSAATTYAGVASQVTSVAHLHQGLGAGVGEAGIFNYLIPSCNNASLRKPILADGGFFDSSGAAKWARGVGLWDAGNDQLSGFQLLPSSGELASGVARMRELELYESGDVGSTFGPWTLKSITESSAAANIDWTLGSGLRDVIIGVGVLLSADGAALYSRVGTGGGVQSGATYLHNIADQTSASSAYAAINGASSVAHLVSGIGGAAGENGMYIFSIPNLAGTHRACMIKSSLVDSSGNAKMATGAGAYTGDTDDLTTFRVLPSTGTITGTFYHFTLGE